MPSSFVFPFGMFATLIDAVCRRAVPSQLFRANVRTVIRHADALLQVLKMSVTCVRARSFARPAAVAHGEGQRVQQIVLVFSRQIAKGCLVTPNAFTIDVAETVQERFL